MYDSQQFWKGLQLKTTGHCYNGSHIFDRPVTISDTHLTALSNYCTMKWQIMK